MAGELTSASMSTGNPYVIAAAAVADIAIGTKQAKAEQKALEEGKRVASLQQTNVDIAENNKIRELGLREQGASHNAQIKALLARGRARVASKGVGGLGIARRENQQVNVASAQLQQERAQIASRVRGAQLRKRNASVNAGVQHTRINKQIKDAAFSPLGFLTTAGGGAMSAYGNGSFGGGETDQLKSGASTSG